MEKIKVLIVENETIIAKDIEKAILELEFEVTGIASSFAQVRRSIKKIEPDIVLMDIKLKGDIDGIEITKRINKKKDIPVIYITGVDDPAVMKKAFATKPAGYLVKPICRSNVKSTTLLGLYRANKLKAVKKDIVCEHIGYDYYFDFNNKKLYFKEMQIKVSKKEIKFLELLLQAEGKPVSFETIEDTIWENQSISNSAIRTLVYRLRLKVEAELIESVPYAGFRINYLKAQIKS